MYKIIPQTLYRKGLKEKILQTSMQMFKVHGIKAVKMDDIATRLSISKRTLYEIYANKEDLLLEGIRLHEKENNDHMDQFSKQAGLTVMDILVEIYHLEMQDLANVSPLFFSDLHKYPHIVSFLTEKHDERKAQAQAFFKLGIEEGYFRKDVDYKFMMNIGNSITNIVMEQQMYKEYGMKHIYHNLIFLFIRGFCTQRGIEVIDKIFPQED
jgi:AcrR family transcriptional regulator